jgi:hypothetical protein
VSCAWRRPGDGSNGLSAVLRDGRGAMPGHRSRTCGAGSACHWPPSVGRPLWKLHSARLRKPGQAASVRGQSNQELSAVLRAGRASTAGLSPLSTPDSFLMCYRKWRKYPLKVQQRSYFPDNLLLQYHCAHVVSVSLFCARSLSAVPGRSPCQTGGGHAPSAVAGGTRGRGNPRRRYGAPYDAGHSLQGLLSTYRARH